MPLVVPSTVSTTKLKKFNGIRRTRDGLLYITTIDRESVSDEYTVSKYWEDGKTQDVVDKATAEENYIEDRLEKFNSQSFIGDGSTKTFTLNANMGTFADRLAVYVDGVLKVAYTDYTVSGTTLTFVGAPGSSKSVEAAQVTKKFFNNDSDVYQQFTFGTDANYLINSTGDLVKRENKTVSGLQSGSDYDSYSESGQVNSTTYQSAI